MNFIKRYVHWLHTQWPAGKPERLPLVNDDYTTNVPGLYITGDLTGIPLLKFSADAGAKVVHAIVNDPNFQNRTQSPPDVLDVAIIGAGVSGYSAALEADAHGLNLKLFETAQPLFTIVNFPKGKPIYTYPTDMTPSGRLQFHNKSDVKEGLLEDLREQTAHLKNRTVIERVEFVQRQGKIFELMLSDSPPVRAHRVIVGIGCSGNFRKLNVPGESLDKVYNRLHDPADFCGQDVLVVGGGDSAVEAAVALTTCGCNVTLSYRKAEFSRPKAENIKKLRMLAADSSADVVVEQLNGDRVTAAAGAFMGRRHRAGSLTLELSSHVLEIQPDLVVLQDGGGQERSLPNKAVFTMIGREPPLKFFRRSGVKIRGEWRVSTYLSLALILALCVFVYHWKKPGVVIADVPPLSWIARIGDDWSQQQWFPYNVPPWWAGLGSAFDRPSNLLGTLKVSLGEPGFYYSLAYCAAVVVFGVRRVRRRKTPYVKVQTLTLMAVQLVPLFVLPYILLPWAGHNGWFDGGVLGWLGDQLFPQADYGHGREYWRAFGLVLAWPLFIWNVFTEQPMWLWLVISLIQTCVLIPIIIYFWGKGAYCGWICSCGALAETMGDAHRHKMPHGPGWNRLNLLGQGFLLFAVLLLLLRLVGWMFPDSIFSRCFRYLLHDLPGFNYVWFVDLLWAGILGVGLYWHFSGRVWCRFACPLAALMHIYTRVSRFRILADKKKCISCNVCTAVCHQGIDVMNFANKGLAMQDPECVRCSACVQSCPTGVLQFGQIERKTGQIISRDTLVASLVRLRESE